MTTEHEELSTTGDDTNSAAEESTGNEALDKQLASGILKGDQGIEAAQSIIAGALIVIFGFLLHFNSLYIPFHGAGQALFVESGALHHPSTFTGALEALPHAPLTALGLAKNFWITGGPVGLNAVSLAAHLLNALLLFLVVRSLLKPGSSELLALLAGLAFVAHPIAAEPMHNLAARGAVFGATFSLIMLLLVARTLKQPEAWLPRALAAICYAIAFGSSYYFWPLPLAALAMGRQQQKTWRESWNAAMLPVATMGLLLAAIFGSGLHSVPAEALTLTTWLAWPGHAVLSVLWPVTLAYYPAMPTGTAVWLGVGITAVLVALYLFAALKRSAFFIPLTWTLIPLAGVPLLMAPYTLPSYEAVYFTVAALALFAPLLVERIAGGTPRAVAGAIAAAIVLGLAILSYDRTQLWRDPQAFWVSETTAHPDSVAGWKNLARFMTAQADVTAEQEIRNSLLQSTQPQWQEVLRLEPDNAEAMEALGIILYTQEKPVESEARLKEALSWDVTRQRAAIYLAMIHEGRLRQKGAKEDLLGALDYFALAESLGTLAPGISERYGMLLASAGMYTEAAPRLRDALANNANHPAAPTLKQVQTMAQQIEQTELAINQKLLSDPASQETQLARAQSMILTGHFQHAYYALRNILEKTPGQATAWPLLGFACAQLGYAETFTREQATVQDAMQWQKLGEQCALGNAWDGARTYLLVAAGLEPALAHPLVTLGNAALRMGQGSRAQAYFEQASKEKPDDPAPWLGLADLAVASKNKPLAAAHLGEAEKRGADPEAVKKRREGGDLPSSAPVPGAVRTIIR
ncbi:MAG: tetratricopeptide repeat protein [Candidatus Hydrogenedentes bacterium]|nr:tetratricopeptide repeat protein [Candidatus Hydrogenedentota bacterium]